MTDLNDFPELVRHLRLDASFKRKRTVHRLRNTRQGSQRKETWVRERKIGHGGYGEVWLERRAESYGSTTELRAVKCIHASLRRREYGRELEALATFSSNKSKYNEFFVQFHGWFESTEWLHVVMEYCEHGDLRDYLGNHGSIPEADTQDITRQLLVGLSLMHEAGFAHRDIKPANILVKSAPPAHWWVKLGDLGLSKRAEAVSGSSTVRATPGFIPPELYGLTREDPKHIDPFYSDVWCLAETVYRILTDRESFDSFVKLNDYVGHRMPFPEEVLIEANTSEIGIAFIQSLMAPLPLERMSAEQALKHPWILLDEDAKSDSEDTASVQSESTVASVSPDCDGDITQPATNWTSDIETTGLEDLSKLSFGVAEIDGNIIRHEDQLMQCSSTKTISSPRRCNHQAYVEDGSEDSSTDGGTGTITHSRVAGVKSPGATEDADKNGARKNSPERGMGEKESAGTHGEGDVTGDVSLSASTGPAPATQRLRPPVNRLPDLIHQLPASRMDSDLPPRLADQEKCNPDSSWERHEPQRQRESTKDMGSEHMSAPKGAKAHKSMRPQNLQERRERIVRFASRPESGSKQPWEHKTSEEAYSFISFVQSSNGAQHFRSVPACLLSRRILGKAIGSKNKITQFDDHVEFEKSLSKKEIVTMLRIHSGDREQAGLDYSYIPGNRFFGLADYQSESDSDSSQGSTGDDSNRPRSILKQIDGAPAFQAPLDEKSSPKLTKEAVERLGWEPKYMPTVYSTATTRAHCGGCRKCRKKSTETELERHALDRDPDAPEREPHAAVPIRASCYNCRQKVDAYQGRIGRHISCRRCGANLGWLPPASVDNSRRHESRYQGPIFPQHYPKNSPYITEPSNPPMVAQHRGSKMHRSSAPQHTIPDPGSFSFSNPDAIFAEFMRSGGRPSQDEVRGPQPTNPNPGSFSFSNPESIFAEFMRSGGRPSRDDAR